MVHDAVATASSQDTTVMDTERTGMYCPLRDRIIICVYLLENHIVIVLLYYTIYLAIISMVDVSLSVSMSPCLFFYSIVYYNIKTLFMFSLMRG